MAESMKKTFCAGTRRLDPKPVQAGATVRNLIDTAFTAYNAARIREACELFKRWTRDDDVLVGMSVAGALTPAGLGCSCLVPLIEHGYIDWMVCTGANLYHDLHFSLNEPLFSGSPHYDDRKLRENNVVRIYDIVFDYSVLLNTDRFVKTVCSSEEFNKKMGCAELHWLIGKYACEREQELGLKHRSLLSSAFLHDVPVYTSSPGDSSLGMNIAALALEGSGPELCIATDVNETAAFVYEMKKNKRKSAVCILGGGSPKNFVLQTEPYIQEILGLPEAGHDYFLQITDARPDTGGLSGATPSEAVSWGKIDPAALQHTVVVYTDAAVVLPLLCAYVLDDGEKRSLKRLYKKRDTLVRAMRNDARSVDCPE